MVAKSSVRIFFRNAIAQGLAILTCPNVAVQFEEGDLIELDVERALVKNITRGTVIQGTPLSEDLLEILRKGGVLQLLKEKKR